MPRQFQEQVKGSQGMMLKYWCPNCFNVTFEPWASVPEMELPCECAERTDEDGSASESA
jgi:hypothetical protein